MIEEKVNNFDLFAKLLSRRKLTYAKRNKRNLRFDRYKYRHTNITKLITHSFGPSVKFTMFEIT